MRGALEAVARRAWAGRSAGDRTLRAALVPAAVAYGAVATLRNRLYDAGWIGARRVPARVVSVGNLTVGGTGKTPAALWLAERLSARNRRVAIVARGYRKRRRGVVVVGESGRALVGPEEGGDEAVMLARRFPGPVVTGERRAEAAAFACARFAVDTLVLDDGFQHRALARDADLVLVTEEALAAWPLPAGPLRERPDALARARAALSVDGTATLPGHVPLFRASVRAVSLVSTAPGGEIREAPLDSLRGRRVVAVAGIAHPERFTDTLTRAGAVVTDVVTFPDHHPYTRADAAQIARTAANTPIITTEKDLVKLERFPDLTDLRALRIALEVEDGDRLLDLLMWDPNRG